jgi:hypothetical protein
MYFPDRFTIDRPTGVIPVYGATVKTIDAKLYGKPNCFGLTSATKSQRMYVLEAESEVQMNDWIIALEINGATNVQKKSESEGRMSQVPLKR